MSTVKDEVKKLLDAMPDDVTFEDVQYHLYVRQKVARGLEDVAAGRTLSREQVERRMAKWLDPSAGQK